MGYSMPYFTIWAAEMLADGRFQTWNLEERGAWLTLLAYNWNDEDLPAAHTDLARLLHVGPGDMARIWSAIGDRFAPVPGKPTRIWSPRLEEERDNAVALSQKRGKAGKKGATARWDKEKKRHSKRIRLPKEPQCEGDGEAEANRCPPTPPPPPSSPPTPPSTTSQPSDHQPVGLAGESDELQAFRVKLGEALKVSMGPSRRQDVTAFFEEQLSLVGPEVLLADCLAMARKSTTGTPSSLSWFVPWLKNLPRACPPAPRDEFGWPTTAAGRREA